MWNFRFFFNSILLGVGLAMDAFSVSMANGLNEPAMKKNRMSMIAGVFAFFQFLMPMIGWICVHTIVQYFKMFEKFIPWIALFLLLYIGGSMLKSLQSPALSRVRTPNPRRVPMVARPALSDRSFRLAEE